MLEAEDKYYTDEIRFFDSYHKNVKSDITYQGKVKCKKYAVRALLKT